MVNNYQHIPTNLLIVNPFVPPFYFVRFTQHTNNKMYSTGLIVFKQFNSSFASFTTFIGNLACRISSNKFFYSFFSVTEIPIFSILFLIRISNHLHKQKTTHSKTSSHTLSCHFRTVFFFTKAIVTFDHKFRNCFFRLFSIQFLYSFRIQCIISRCFITTLPLDSIRIYQKMHRTPVQRNWSSTLNEYVFLSRISYSSHWTIFFPRLFLSYSFLLLIPFVSFCVTFLI